MSKLTYTCLPRLWRKVIVTRPFILAFRFLEKYVLSKLHFAGNANTKVKYCQNVDSSEHFRELWEKLNIILSLTDYYYFPLDTYHHVMIFYVGFIFIFSSIFTLRWRSDHLIMYLCAVQWVRQTENIQANPELVASSQHRSRAHLPCHTAEICDLAMRPMHTRMLLSISSELLDQGAWGAVCIL